MIVRKRHDGGKDKTVTQASKSCKPKRKANEIMIVNDDPGISTRIAICDEGRLEELYTERAKTATSVGNIYKGRVTNVESAIQAAFVEYGEPQRGFLHVTDLHPRYFPGNETSERVGKKVARHARPPIQKCLKKGDEVLIQVMKEGVGTKGPTLTSYLSIPGRLSVMMPYMDKVGVSRKIDDLEERRELRKVFDSINLPSGFGFILRTAGKGKNTAEIKRDIAYLVRLWKLIEKRINTITAPCPLYNESDLVVRTIRDILRSSIGAIVVDSEAAYGRIKSFLKVATPRSTRKIIRYSEPLPIFHAFDLERQIEEIHNREVLLPSGGRLVIDQTEALVAIDVNSGKSRGAKNSETNAFNTNMEAADEICRQLRLRDLGGLVINDLIDMSRVSNRRKVEERFESNLERDRAKASVLPISRFGLMEMTRQRMRPSVLESHYAPCLHCDGRGIVKTPEEVASDASRHAGWILRNENVHRVELVCSSSVGSSLLSNKRIELNMYEKYQSKRIVVRISDSLATDQVSYFAYDKRGADIDVTTLPSPEPPSVQELLALEKGRGKRLAKSSSSKRGRRQKKVPLADAGTIADVANFDAEVAELGKPVKSKSRRKSSKSQKGKKSPAQSAMRVYELARRIGKSSKEVIERCKKAEISVSNHMSALTTAIEKDIENLFDGELGTEKSSPPKRRRRRGGTRRRGRVRKDQVPASDVEVASVEETSKPKEAVKSKRGKSNTRSRRRTKKQQGEPKADSKKTETRRPKKKVSSSPKKSKKKKVSRSKKKTRAKTSESKPQDNKNKLSVERRTLYGSSRRTVSSEEASSNRGDRE